MAVEEAQPEKTAVHRVVPITFTPPPSSVDTVPSPAGKSSIVAIITSFHAGYFRISLSLCSQALLWKTLSSPSTDPHGLRPILRALPSFAFLLLWSLALLSLLLLSLLFVLRCLLRPQSLRAELSHPIGMNYFFAPFASSLLLLQSTPFIPANSALYRVLCCLLCLPILCLDVKIYGGWFTHGKNFLSLAANPTSQVSVIGNLVGARAVAEMGWKEAGTCVFALGIAHYLVIFVTLYQRLVDGSVLPAMLRPAFFLLFAAPSMASLAWDSIAGDFDISCRMLFFLSLFLFTTLVICERDTLIGHLRVKIGEADHYEASSVAGVSESLKTVGEVQVSRPKLFKRSIRKFDIAWWAYSFPLTVLALAATEYTQNVKLWLPNVLMVVLTLISVTVTIMLLVFTAIRPNSMLPDNDPFQSPATESRSSPSTLPCKGGSKMYRMTSRGEYLRQMREGGRRSGGRVDNKRRRNHQTQLTKQRGRR
ncbi:S-type anion channel SLAH1 [Platanthera guangdongensis]|uniref:S-type anion channel SLAH1 n=1 Tax=Platanthera guangdongensis TaxID=2320717 RepID=A0ABR2LPY2_9ASPA